MINLIGIFDSGNGAYFVADRLSSLISNKKFLIQTDLNNAPYGTKSKKQIIELSKKAIKPLVDKGCNPIVIACNTATTSSIHELRNYYPNIDFIGFDPMIKPAVKESKNKSIMILATPATLKSKRYKFLKLTYAKNCKIFEPDCQEWAGMIDNNKIKQIDLSKISKQIETNSCDVIVIACTHYISLIDTLKLNHPDISIMEPTKSIADRIISLGY